MLVYLKIKKLNRQAQILAMKIHEAENRRHSVLSLRCPNITMSTEMRYKCMIELDKATEERDNLTVFLGIIERKLDNLKTKKWYHWV